MPNLDPNYPTLPLPLSYFDFMQKDSWLTMVPSRSIKMQTISDLHNFSLISVCVPVEFFIFNSCPSVFTRVQVVHIRVFLCSSVFHSCSPVFIGAHLCSFVVIGVDSCSTRVHCRISRLDTKSFAYV